MTTKKSLQLAKEFYEVLVDVFDRQHTASPCIYEYEGKINFSRGDTLGGTALPVYNGEAKIIFDSEELRSIYETYDEKTAISLIAEELR